MTEPAAILERFIQEWRDEAGPRPKDDKRTFPAGHDMTERRYVLHQLADVLATALAATRPVVTREKDVWWIALNGQGQIIGGYRTKEQAHENSAYVVGLKPGLAAGRPSPTPPKRAMRRTP